MCGCGILCKDKSRVGISFALVAEEVDAVYDIESLNACNAGLVESNQDIADDKAVQKKSKY